jgi:hypothetical protein
VGTSGIRDFALSDNSKECGVVVMCQCSIEYLVKIYLNLKMGSEQFSQLLDAQRKTMITIVKEVQRYLFHLNTSI